MARRDLLGNAIPERPPVYTPPAVPYTPPAPEVITKVRIVDFDMPFESMLKFMLKWAIAAVPALIILAVCGFVLSAVFAGALLGVHR